MFDRDYRNFRMQGIEKPFCNFFFNVGKISFNMATLIFTLLIRVLQGTASVVW